MIICLENQFLVFFLSGRLRQVLLYTEIDGTDERVPVVHGVSRQRSSSDQSSTVVTVAKQSGLSLIWS